MNGVDRTKFDPRAAAPYKGRQVRWHGQPGSFRDDAQGNLVWTPNTGATFGSNGIEDITGKLGVATGQAGGMQYQYDPATGGVTSTGLAPPPPPPPPGTVQEPSGPEQQSQPPGPSFPSEEAESQNAMFSAAFGSRQGDPNFNVNFDYNQDGIINYDDHLQFGQSFAPPPVDPINQQIDSNIDSMMSNLGNQAWQLGGLKQAPSEQYFQQHLDGYKTYLRGLSDDQRNKAFATPHKSYRNYVIDQFDATPELGNVLRGGWTSENVNAVAQSIASGQGVLNLEYLESIPEELLSRSNKNHIRGVVNDILRPPLTKPAGAVGDPSGEVTDLDPNIQGAGVSEDDITAQVTGISQFMRSETGRDLDDAYYRNLLTEEGFSPDQVERIIRESRGIATGADTNVDDIFSQMQDGTFDEDAIRAQLLQQGYTPQEVAGVINEATTRYEESLTPVEDPGVDPGVDEGFPPGWVDADNDGFDDNTNLDIDGNPKLDTWLDIDSDGYDDITGLDRQGYPKDKTQTQPKFPDTDDNIQNILTYLQETLTQTEGIDDIAVKELADFSRSSKRAQEQLLEDLNRLGLVGLESGDAQAALGEFAAGVLAEKRQIRADSAVRVRENIDRLIKATGLQVSQTEADARIKMLQDSIESRDQLALFNGLISVLGPDALDLLGPIGEKIKEETKKAGNRLWDWGKNALGLGDDVIAGTEAYKNLKKLLPDKTDKEIIELLKRTIEGQEEIDFLTVVRLPDGTEITWEELEPSIVERSGPSQPEQPGESFDYDRWSEYGLIDPGQAAINKEQVTSIIDDIGDIKELEYDSRSSTRLSTQTLWALQSMDLNGDNLISSGEVVEFMSLYPEEIQTVQTYFDQHPDIERNRDGDIRRKGGKTGWAKFGSFVGAIILQAGRSIQSGGNKYTKRSDGEVIVELVES
jgi:hypothetical protein